MMKNQLAGLMTRERAQWELFGDSWADTLPQKARERLAQLSTVGDVGYDAVLLPEAGPRLRTVAALLLLPVTAITSVLLGPNTSRREPAPVPQKVHT